MTPKTDINIFPHIVRCPLGSRKALLNRFGEQTGPFFGDKVHSLVPYLNCGSYGLSRTCRFLKIPRFWSSAGDLGRVKPNSSSL